jgi:hypothetical protein
MTSMMIFRQRDMRAGSVSSVVLRQITSETHSRAPFNRNFIRFTQSGDRAISKIARVIAPRV